MQRNRRSLPNNFSLVSPAPKVPSSHGGPPTPSQDSKFLASKITTSTPKPAKSVQEILSLYKPLSSQLNKGSKESLGITEEEPQQDSACKPRGRHSIAGTSSQHTEAAERRVAPSSSHGDVIAKLRLARKPPLQRSSSGPMRALHGIVDGSRPQPSASTPDNGERRAKKLEFFFYK